MTVPCGCGRLAKALRETFTTRSECNGSSSFAFSKLGGAEARCRLSVVLLIHQRDFELFPRVFSTCYTLDTRFVLSGSDDANLRIWKARAADKLGVVDKKEQVSREYRDELRSKWGQVAEVSKIERQRYLPKPIHQATKLRREMLDAANSKEENRRRHAPKGVDPEHLKPKPQRKVAIQKVES